MIIIAFYFLQDGDLFQLLQDTSKAINELLDIHLSLYLYRLDIPGSSYFTEFYDPSIWHGFKTDTWIAEDFYVSEGTTINVLGGRLGKIS